MGVSPTREIEIPKVALEWASPIQNHSSDIN